MTILDGPEAEDKIKGLLSSGTHIQIAVAYWGNRAFERLGMAKLKGRDIRIICNLMSGGCNPKEIKVLLDTFGKERVLKHSQLHAKVWLTNKGAVVGSSNASANGLGYEGNETCGLIEANVFIDDSTTLQEIEKWLENKVDPGISPITDADLRKAEYLWKRRRTQRPLPIFGSLLEGLRTNPDYFANRNLFVWAWEHERRDKWAEKTLKLEKHERGNNRIDCWQDVGPKSPPPGAYIIDFDLNKNRSATVTGLYQVLLDDPKIKTDQGMILLCKPVSKFEGLVLGDKQIWRDAASRAVQTDKNKGEWPIEEFAPRFLQ